MKLVSLRIVNGKRVFRISDKMKLYLVTDNGVSRSHQKIIVPFDETESCRYTVVNSDNIISRLNEIVDNTSLSTPNGSGIE